ncbi:unnamed protein product [Amoebophrya sp. A120]|nr:unnamed protein product [Amoebophrya sp. A120]|eukprot:GSA120T00013545001.1
MRPPQPPKTKNRKPGKIYLLLHFGPSDAGGAGIKKNRPPCACNPRAATLRRPGNPGKKKERRRPRRRLRACESVAELPPQRRNTMEARRFFFFSIHFGPSFAGGADIKKRGPAPYACNTLAVTLPRRENLESLNSCKPLLSDHESSARDCLFLARKQVVGNAAHLCLCLALEIGMLIGVSLRQFAPTFFWHIKNAIWLLLKSHS